jgi:hypothetical protein
MLRRNFSARAVCNALGRTFPIQRRVVVLVAVALALYHFRKGFLSKGDAMVKAQALLFGFLMGLLAPYGVMAQGMGEYSRSVQGATERQKGARPQKTTASGPRNLKGKNDVPGVGDLGGKPVASKLVVAADEAGLYPRQDDESEKISQLSRGVVLIPVLQSNGGNEWFMVKSPGGKVGWVKAADVREEPGKNP